MINSVKILREYERGVVFRLGRVLPAPKGPGVILIFRPFDQMVRVSLRQEVLEVPPQDIITRDNVTLKVNAVITLKVIDPSRAVIEVMNYVYQTSQFAQTTLRSVLGEVELDELLSRRESLNQRIQSIIDQHTAPWGVKVVSVEVKQVDLPESMLRAMAKQAEAEREKRAKVIHAEGEFSAAQRLVDAAALLATQPMTLQLRYLQTLTEIGVEKNTTIVFPLPLEMMTLFNKMGDVREKRAMRTLFDTDEEEIEGKASEITLSTASLLGIFFGLVLVCGVFFGFGYSMGRGTGAAQATLVPRSSRGRDRRGRCGESCGAGSRAAAGNERAGRYRGTGKGRAAAPPRVAETPEKTLRRL